VKPQTLFQLMAAGLLVDGTRRLVGRPASLRRRSLGCGTAANLERLIALDLPFESYTGVDLSEAMVNRARAKFAHLPNVHFQQLDLLTDPLPMGPFDLVVSNVRNKRDNERQR
jgi:SAM-dependent methyltransferase